MNVEPVSYTHLDVYKRQRKQLKKTKETHDFKHGCRGVPVVARADEFGQAEVNRSDVQAESQGGVESALKNQRFMD